MKQKRKRHIFLKLTVFLILVAMLSASLYFSSNKILEEYGVATFNSVISSASYNAVEDILVTNYSYKDLVSVEKNKDGDVIMVLTESYFVNELATKIAQKAYYYLEKKANDGVDIPIGAFSGIRMLGGFGTKIRMKLLSVASVKCNIYSEFQEAGINQTRHLMYIDIASSVAITTKLKVNTVNDSITILVYDNLIIGKVPQVMLTQSIIGSGNC